MMIEQIAVGDVAVQQKMLRLDEKIDRSYDVVLAVLSWESRGPAAFSHLADKTREVTLLKFKSRSDEIEAAKQIVFEQFKSEFSSIKMKEIESSTNVQENHRLLKAWIQDLYSSVGRPLSILIDITCLPKSYILYLLGLGFCEELFSRFDCLYTPGKYDLLSPATKKKAAISGPRSLISEGEWRSHQIPYLEASQYFANDRDLLVTIGGELGLSLPFIERYEPRRLGLVFISETAPSASGEMLESERLAYDALLRETNIVRNDIRLCDVVSVAKHALEFVRTSRSGGTTAMTIGSKPHALALGIAALADPAVEVVCRTPASYRLVDVAASGRVMLYEIVDRFDPTSHF